MYLPVYHKGYHRSGGSDKGILMALQLYLGCSGSGKSHKLYEHIIEESLKHPKLNYYILVPEQYNLSTQQKLISMHPQKGILNIDVLSFTRLAHRVFEEVGYSHAKGATIDDIGKNLILRHMAGRNEDKLTALKGSFDKLGYISEIKSVISEFMQYGIGDKELADLIGKSEGRGTLKQKLTDIRLLYNEFLKYINEKYITTEEILQKVRDEVPRSKKLKNTVIVLDGYTGFTPVQRGLIGELLVNCVDVYVTLLMDTSVFGTLEADQKLTAAEYDEQDIFCLSYRTIAALDKICRDRDIVRREDVILAGEVPARYMYDKDGNIISDDKRRHDLIHLEKNLFRLKEEGFSQGRLSDRDSIHIFCGTDPYEEAVEAAVRIKRLISEAGYRYKDIAVVTGDIDTYMRSCGQAFSAYDIPFFVDKNAPVLLNPVIECIRSLFDIMTTDYSYESVFRYLRTSLDEYPKEDIDILENYVLRYGIRGRRAWKEEFIKKPRDMDEAKLEAINDTRDHIAAELDVFFNDITAGSPGAGGKNTVDAVFDVRLISTALYTFLSEHKIQEKAERMRSSFEEAGDRMHAMEYGRIYEEVCDLLNKMVMLLPGEKLTLKDYASLLDAGFAEIRTGILPGTDDYVQIGDITRTRLRDIKALFFMGVNDGIIPMRKGGGIISDMDREFLMDTNGTGQADSPGWGIEMAPTERMKAYEQRLYLYMLTSKPSDHLFVSYSKLNTEGESLSSSYFVKTIGRMFPYIKTEQANEKSDNRVYGYKSALSFLAAGTGDMVKGRADEEAFKEYLCMLDDCLNDRDSRLSIYGFMKGGLNGRAVEGSDKISRAVARALYGEKLKCSITRLETYAGCAYAHFMKYGLSLKERQLFSFEANDMGSVFHDSLKEYAGILKERDLSWTGVDEKTAGDIIDEAIERTIAGGDYSSIYGSFRTRYSVNRMKRIMNRTVSVLTDHLKNGSFTPDDYEFDFAMGDKVRLIGRVDRMDVCTENGNTYVKIIDYKSGNKQFDLISVYAGLDLQLVVYLNAGIELVSQRLNGSRAIPAGIFYYHIDDPVIRDEDYNPDTYTGSGPDNIDEKILEEYRMSGLVNSDETVYRLMDNDFSSRSRIIPVSVKKDGGFGIGSSVASEEEFNIISDYVNLKITDSGREILNGDIKAEPHRTTRSGNLPCDYCDYADVCGYRGDGICIGPDDIREALEKNGIDISDKCDEKKELIELMRMKTENEG